MDQMSLEDLSTVPHKKFFELKLIRRRRSYHFVIDYTVHSIENGVCYWTKRGNVNVGSSKMDINVY